MHAIAGRTSDNEFTKKSTFYVSFVLLEKNVCIGLFVVGVFVWLLEVSFKFACTEVRVRMNVTGKGNFVSIYKRMLTANTYRLM